MITLEELHTKQEMVHYHFLIKELYATLTLEQYELYLKEMLSKDYKQVLVLENNSPVGLAGFWTGTKLWCGKYLELDNVVISSSHRSKGIGKYLTDYLVNKAKTEQCNVAVLDAYTVNFGAQKFYMNQGFVPKGFHFVKFLNE